MKAFPIQQAALLRFLKERTQDSSWVLREPTVIPGASDQDTGETDGTRWKYGVALDRSGIVTYPHWDFTHPVDPNDTVYKSPPDEPWPVEVFDSLREMLDYLAWMNLDEEFLAWWAEQT